MTQTPNPPAGWYPQGTQERWWDGNAWSDNFRPLGSDPGPQVTQPVTTAGYPNTFQPTAQPGYAQPAYGQPQYATPQTYLPQQPVKQSHTARNLLIVFGVIFLVFVGGCVAVVAVIGNKVNDTFNDDSLGGPNNPMTITEGKAFEVNGFKYADGWSITEQPVSQTWTIDNLKVTNDRGKADRLDVKISLLSTANNEVLATAFCIAGDGFEKIPKGTTVKVDCTATDPLPDAYDKITIQDVV